MIFPSATEEGLPPHRPYHTDHPVEGYSLHSLPNTILHKGVVRLYTATHPTVLCDQWLWTDIEEIFSRQRQIGREELFAAWNVAHRIIAAGGRRTTYGICVTSSCFPTTNFVLRFHSLIIMLSAIWDRFPFSSSPPFLGRSGSLNQKYSK